MVIFFSSAHFLTNAFDNAHGNLADPSRDHGQQRKEDSELR